MSVIENILTEKGFELSSVYKGIINKDNWKHHSWSVLIQGNGVFVEVDYCKGLGHNAEDGVSADDIIPCLISDSSYAGETFADFCDMLGYDQYDENGRVNKRSEEIWYACKDQLDNLLDLSFTEEERQQIEEYIEEEGL